MGNILQKSQTNNQQQVEEEDNNGEFTCEICFEPAPNSDKKFRNGNKCSHPFCTDCVAKYIAARLDDGGSGQIACPGIGCGNSLAAEASAAVLGPALFVRWCDALCEAAVLTMASCYCPNPQCGAVIVNECGGVVRKSKCPNCKNLFCFECQRFWHAGFSCDDAPTDPDDVVFGRLAEQNRWKRCPRCRHFVERYAGCMGIGCRCGMLFCYKCGQQIRGLCCGCLDTSAWIWILIVIVLMIIVVGICVFLFGLFVGAISF